MSRRLRLASAFMIIAVGVALALHMSPSRAGSTVDPAPARAVGGVAIPVEDMDRSVDFYSTVLFFEKVSDVQTSGPETERLLGVPGARAQHSYAGAGGDQFAAGVGEDNGLDDRSPGINAQPRHVWEPPLPGDGRW